MTLANHKEPFELLLDIELSCKQNAAGLPQQVEVKETWAGIGFRVGRMKLVAALGDVNEILYFPRITKIPGTKNWVMGMANIRGNLMPIIDLHGYLGKPSATTGPRTRILIINHLDLWAGLLVDEVLGIKHFAGEEKGRQATKVEKAFSPYLSTYFQQNNDNWHVFNMKALTESPNFSQVSA